MNIFTHCTPRRWTGLVVVVALGALSARPLAAMTSALSAESAYQIAEAYRMDGVDGVVSGMVAEEIRKELGGEVKGWVLDAIAEGLETPDSGPQPPDPGNIKVKEEIKKRLKEKIKKYLPEIVRRVLYEKLFLGEFGNEVAEVKGMVDRIVAELKVSFNDRADRIAGEWYDKAIAEIDEYLRYSAGPLEFDLTNIRGTLDDILKLENLEWGISESLSEAVGDATASALKKRVEDILAGRLPPEALEYLKLGPERFAEYASKITENLPGKKLDELKDQILHTPLFIIPNGIYGGILAVSASRHITLAYSGVGVNLLELERAGEVTRVLIWQIKNKEGLSVDLATLLDFTKILSEKFGLSLDDLGRLGDTIKVAKEKLGELEAKLDKFDKLIEGRIDLVGDRLKEAADGLQHALEGFQKTLFTPVTFSIGKADALVDNINKQVLDLVPDDFSGIPASWDGFKGQFGIDGGLLGKFGDKSPWDIIQDWASASGLRDAYEKFKKDTRRTVDDINDAVSGALATAGTEVVDAFGFTDPLAGALGIPEIPAQNPSIENPLDPVLLHNGEFYYSSTDLVVPGRGLDYEFARVYRSRGNFYGVMGHNWTHNYRERLVPDGDRVIYVDPGGKRYVFECAGVPEYRSSGVPVCLYHSPSGIFSVLYPPEGERPVYTLRAPDGMRTLFAGNGLMVAKEDRSGNRLLFEYDKYGRLAKVIDALGRDYKYSYNKQGLLAAVEDFSGRRLTFRYDRYGDLVAATGPVSFDYPDGKIKRYSYSFGKAKGDLNHNMTRVMDPAGNIYLKLSYGEAATGFDRVVEQQYGAGGRKMSIEYKSVVPPYMLRFLNAFGGQWVDMVTVGDKRGVVHIYRHNAGGNLLNEAYVDESGVERPIFAGRYNRDGLKVYSRGRDGIGYEFIYDEENPERSSQGNLLEEIRADRSGREEVIRRAGYETVYNRPKSVTLYNGVKYDFDYDKDKTVLKITGGDGQPAREMEYLYNDHGQLVSYTDPEGNIFSYQYDGGDLVADPAGFRYTYDQAGNVIEAEDPLGNKTRYILNALNQLVTEVAPPLFNYKKRYVFDQNDNISEIITPDGMRYRYLYDDLDNVISLSLEVEKDRFVTTRWERDPDGRILKAVRPEGNSVEYKYNYSGNLIQIVRGAGTGGEQVVRLGYNKYGDLTVLTDGAGRVTQIIRDDLGRERETVEPGGTRRVQEYDKSGRVVDVKWIDCFDRLLAETRYIYDSLGRLTERRRRLFDSDPKDSRWISEGYLYNKRDEVIRLTDAGGNSWRYAYDRWGNIIAVGDPLGNRVEYEYDSTSKPVRSTVFEIGGGRIVTEFSHDPLGRLTGMTDVYGGTTAFEYDGMGNVIRERGPRGFLRGYSYDGIGRRRLVNLQIDAGRSAITQFLWDGNGRLREITDANGHKTRYEYDALDRLRQTTYADGSEERFEYDSADNVIIKRDRNGVEIYQLFDSSDRLVGRRVAPPSGSGARGTTWQWFSYDGLGRLNASLDNNDPDDHEDDALQFYRYDSLSRRIGEAYGDKWVITNYDEFGSPRIVKYPSGKTVYYMRDPLGRIKDIFLDGRHLVSYENSGINKVASIHRRNGLESVVGSDLLSNIVRLSERGNKLKGVEYTYLPDGLVKSEASQGEGRNYTYDGMGRLTGVDGATQYSWGLDGVGNWLEYSSGGVTRRGEYDEVNRLLNTDTKIRYGYDGLGRLVAVSDLSGELIARYTYDVHNRRMTKVIAGTPAPRHTGTPEHRYIYNGWNVIEEYKGDGLADLYVQPDFPGGPVYMQQGSNGYYYHTDRLGSVIALSDDEGRVIEEYSYHPYGMVVRHPDTPEPRYSPYTFTAQRLDPETCLYYFRNRYYNPLEGRFTTEDPLGYGADLYSSVYNIPNGSRFSSMDYTGMDARRRHLPQMLITSKRPDIVSPEMNLYQYALSNPLNFTDPLGLRVFLEQRGNNIDIHITIETWGPYANGDMNRLIKNSVEDIWHGRFGRYKVNTIADVVLRGDSTDYDRHRMIIQDRGISQVDCAGCSTSNLYMYDSRNGDPVDAATIAHEVGHFFGNGDHYTVAGGEALPKPGWEYNLMACVDSGCHLNEQNITEMLEAYRKGRMNIGLHRPPEPNRYANRRRQRNNNQNTPASLDYK